MEGQHRNFQGYVWGAHKRQYPHTHKKKYANSWHVGFSRSERETDESKSSKVPPWWLRVGAGGYVSHTCGAVFFKLVAEDAHVLIGHAAAVEG